MELGHAGGIEGSQPCLQNLSPTSAQRPGLGKGPLARFHLLRACPGFSTHLIYLGLEGTLVCVSSAINIQVG